MKDYYNILGVKKNATYYHITEAYRELSVKYHPDNHDGNEEYIEKYNDVQEAYATLSNGIKRRDYDNHILHLEKTVKEKDTNANPTIEFFKTDKSEFEYGEEITFSWKSLNADRVTLVPFGPVQTVGSYTTKIQNYKNKLLTYELLAENTLNGRETKAAVTLKNRNFEEIYSHFKKELESKSQSITIAPTSNPSKEIKSNEIEPKEQEFKEVEKEHLKYLPGNKEIIKEKKQNTRFVPPAEQRIEPTPIPEPTPIKEFKKPEKSENNILFYIVILFLIFGISALVYLGFFLE